METYSYERQAAGTKSDTVYISSLPSSCYIQTHITQCRHISLEPSLRPVFRFTSVV